MRKYRTFGELQSLAHYALNRYRVTQSEFWRQLHVATFGALVAASAEEG